MKNEIVAVVNISAFQSLIFGWIDRSSCSQVFGKIITLLKNSQENTSDGVILGNLLADNSMAGVFKVNLG